MSFVCGKFLKIDYLRRIGLLIWGLPVILDVFFASLMWRIGFNFTMGIASFGRYISYHIFFPWASSFENEVRLISKSCKWKFSKASVSVGVWIGMSY